VLVSIGAIPVALSTAETPVQPTEVEVNIRRLFKISPAGTVGCLATGIANGAFWSLAPVFTAGVSDNTALAAWFMSAAVVGGAVAQWPLGYLSDKLGRRKTLSGASVCGAIIAAVIVLFHDQLDFVNTSALGAAWGFFAFPMYAIAVAHANDNADPSDYVMVSSGLLLAYGAGAVIGPFAASAVMALTGFYGLYLLTGLTHVLAAGYVVFRIFRRDSRPAEQHIPFGDALATAHTASQVYEEEYRHHVEEESPEAA
jgi:MFS family permease